MHPKESLSSCELNLFAADWDGYDQRVQKVLLSLLVFKRCGSCYFKLA